MRPWITVEGVYISAPSKNKEAAYDFVKYVTDIAAAKILAIEGRQTPANKNVYNDAAVAADAILIAFKSASRSCGSYAESPGNDNGLVSGHHRDE